MTDILAGIVAPSMGVIIGNAMWLSPMPDIQEALRNLDMKDLNPLPWSMSFVNCVLWAYYGKLGTPDPYIFCGNIPGIGLGLYYTLTTIYLIGIKTGRSSPSSSSSTLRTNTNTNKTSTNTNTTTTLANTIDPYNYRVLCMCFIIGGAVGINLCIFLFDSYLYNTDTIKIIIGSLASFFAIVYFSLPCYTMREVIKLKNSNSIQGRMVLANLINCTSWVVYGLFAINDIWVWGPNLVGFVLAICQLVLKQIYPSFEVDSSSGSGSDSCSGGLVNSNSNDCFEFSLLNDNKSNEKI